jgi:ankyrin repeat protein
LCVCACACSDGDTALILAAWYGHVDITKLLLEANATVDATNCDGNCALNCAAYHGFMEVCPFRTLIATEIGRPPAPAPMP